MAKPLREYKVVIFKPDENIKNIYVYSVSKGGAYLEAIRSYMRWYRVTRAEAKKKIKRRNVKLWRNADGSIPAWRQKKWGKKAAQKRRRGPKLPLPRFPIRGR